MSEQTQMQSKRRPTQRMRTGGTVVITGASSGIGRAAALLFARRGWNVVVASRQEGALQTLAYEVAEAGQGPLLPVQTDVTDNEQVERLAERAVERFGAIDVWVNDAAVSVMGPFEQLPEDDFRRVIETDLMGYVHGARAALKRFRRQGHGTLINVSSAAALVTQPYAAPYTAAKAGITALSQSLRDELADEPDIEVCTIFPASIDTPFFQHAADFMGREIKPLPPVYPAEDVARAILSCAEKPRPHVYVGMTPRWMRAQKALLPHSAEEKMFERMVRQGHFGPLGHRAYHGNLFSPDPIRNTVSGGWRQSAGGLRGRVFAGLVLGVAVSAVIAAVAMMLRRDVESS